RAGPDRSRRVTVLVLPGGERSAAAASDPAVEVPQVHQLVTTPVFPKGCFDGPVQAPGPSKVHQPPPRSINKGWPGRRGGLAGLRSGFELSPGGRQSCKWFWITCPVRSPPGGPRTAVSLTGSPTTQKRPTSTTTSRSSPRPT